MKFENQELLKSEELKRPIVYMCFSTDIIHSGHIAIIKKAQELGNLVVGVLSDEAIASYRHFPMVPFEERKALFENIAGIYKVIEQKTWGYKEVLNELKPEFLVHGDDWKEGFQKPIRQEVIELLAVYGGKLVEFPYSKDKKYDDLDIAFRRQLATPDMRRARLRKLISMKGCINAIEAHSGITGLIAEKNNGIL